MSPHYILITCQNDIERGIYSFWANRQMYERKQTLKQFAGESGSVRVGSEWQTIGH